MSEAGRKPGHLDVVAMFCLRGGDNLRCGGDLGLMLLCDRQNIAVLVGVVCPQLANIKISCISSEVNST